MLLVAAATTAVLGAWAPRVSIDGSIDRLLVTGDPARAVHAEAQKTFGSDEVTRIGLFAEDVFAPAVLARIDRLSRRLGRLEGVDEVVSLTTIAGIEMTDRGLRAGRILGELPRDAAATEAFRGRVLGDRIYLGSVVAADSRATVITVIFEPMSDERFGALDLEARIRNLIAATPGPGDVAIAGVPTLKVHGARRMEEDVRTFAVWALALVSGVLWLMFRSVRGVTLPLLAVAVSIVWTNGLMAIRGSPITIGSLVLNPLLMAIGVAYAIHVVSRVGRESKPGVPPAQAVASALQKVGVPVTMAAATTLLGFSTLVLHPIPTIRDLGVWAAFGVAVAFLASVTILPAILTLLPPPSAPAGTDSRDRLSRLLSVLAESTARRPGRVITAGILLCVLAAAGMRSLRVETDYLGFFAADSPVRRDADRIAASLAGTHVLYVVVEGAGARALTRPEALHALRDLQTMLDRRPGVDKTISFVDFLSRARDAIEPGLGAHLPSTQAETDQLLLQTNPADLRQVLGRDHSRANVVVYTSLTRSSELGALVEAVDRFSRERMPAGLTVHATGTAILLNRTSDTIAREQLVGLARMLAALSLTLALLFRSIRVGLLSLVPNVFPVVLLFGIMGTLAIPLNVSTSMIAVIALGIAVDDTIHYLTALSSAPASRDDPTSSFRSAVRSVGQPIVFTSAALGVGFLVACLSGFEPVRQFGALSAVTLLIALFADLALTPAIAAVTGFGSNPERSSSEARPATPSSSVEDLPRIGGLHG